MVSDRKRGTVVLLNGKLQVIGQVGRKGAGPGEYREIQAVRGTRAGFVTIDRVLRRVYSYSWIGNAPKLVSMVKLDFEPYDVCPVTGNKYLVLGRRRGARVHVVDAVTGAVLRSGAMFTKNMTVGLSDNLIEGRMSCGGNADKFVVTSAFVPAYDIVSLATLSVIQTDSIRPVRTLTIQSEPRGESFTSSPAGYHSPGRAFAFASRWIIQASVLARSDRKDDGLISVFSRSATGTELFAWSRKGTLFPITRDSAIAVTDEEEVGLAKVSLAVELKKMPGTVKPAR